MKTWKAYLIIIATISIGLSAYFLGDKGVAGRVYSYAPVEAINCLAQNIYFEARAESTAGKIAVGQVVLNRSVSKKFPHGICEVIKQGSHFSNGVPKRDLCQFSWYCDGKSDHPTDRRSWRESLRLAEYLISGRGGFLDITDGALFYHANYVYPRCARRKNETTKIDRHIIYR